LIEVSWTHVLMTVPQAANYLDIKALLDVGCKTVANMIKGKSPEEIRKTFNIQNDFTPEEEDQIRRENEWAEEYDSNPHDFPDGANIFQPLRPERNVFTSRL